MQDKQTAGIFLEIFAVVAVLGILSTVAIPHVGQMTGKGRAAAREAEYHNIQVAVIAMLCESDTGTLVPIGPTTDMGNVCTSDMPPLVLTDYLSSRQKALKPGYTYIFNADGEVIPKMP